MYISDRTPITLSTFNLFHFLISFFLCKDNDFPTECRAFNIKAKKRDLGKAKREIRKKVAELKEVIWDCEQVQICFGFLQARSVEYSTSKETQENINKTFQDLELTAKVTGIPKQ